MLPPVRATLSSFVEYQNPAQQPLLRQRIDVASAADNAGPISTMPLSGGRLDIMSLSAQLQLAHGFSVFAETIGKLIKLPRREGEALADYARRLMEAVQSMTPAQQAQLERMLNQLVKGVSLKLLAQILADPDGPEAARFALRLETAQLRDLAAKAVVSSYRQNSGSELVPGAPARINGAVPPSAGQPPATARAPEASAASLQRAPVQQQAAAPHAETADTADASRQPDETAADAQSREISTRAEQAASPSPQSPASPAATSIPLPTDAEVEAAVLMSSQEDVEVSADTDAAILAEQDVAAEIAESETPDVLEALADEMPETEAEATPHQPAGTARHNAVGASAEERRNSAPVLYDGPALARASQREPDQAGPSLPRFTGAIDKAQATAIAEWLAKALADGNIDMLEPLPETARILAQQLPEQLALEELLRTELAEQPAQRGAAVGNLPAGSASQPGEEADLPLTAANRSLAVPTSANGQPAETSDLAEQLMLPLVLPQMLRDGVAMPYVVYPPEDRERDPEDRKAKPVAETDEDGEQQHSAGEQAFHDERDDQATEDDEEGEQPSDGKAEDEGRPNDLYWRMAGWA